MSRDYWLFEHETGKTAYMAGVIDILSDYLGMICDYGYAFDADIFFVKENNFSLLNDIIKERLHNYNIKEGLNVPKYDIDNLDFKLEAVNNDIKKYLCDAFSRYSSSKKISEKINDFFQDLEWYLKKPICIYEPSKKSVDKIRDVLGHIYLYLAFEYFFIAYDEWVVLFIFGTVE